MLKPRWMTVLVWILGIGLLSACQGLIGISAQGGDVAATLQAYSTRLAEQEATLAAQGTALATLTTPQAEATTAATATTLPTPTATAMPSPTATLAATATTAAAPATPTVAPLGGGAKLTVSTDTFCRVGPDTVFYRLGVVKAGEWVTVLGKWKEYWRVQLPDGTKCWIWGPGATLSGNTAGIPEITPGVGAIWGYVFTDNNHDGVYRQSDDGRKGGTVVYLYPATNGQCNSGGDPLAQTKVNGQSFYTFTFNLSKPTKYCVKAVFTDPNETVCRGSQVVIARQGEPAQADLYTVPCTGPGCQCP